MIKYEWGMDYDQFFAEAEDLILQHWAEVGSNRDVLRFNPDHDLYRRAQFLGKLHIQTARRAGRLVGYMLIFLLQHPRDVGAKIVRDDAIYVIPCERKHAVGYKMIKNAIGYAIDQGAVLAMFTKKAYREDSRYLERLGFVPKEIIYSKVLKGAGHV